MTNSLVASHLSKQNEGWLFTFDESSAPSDSRGTMWFVYMIKNSAGRLYIGVSQNPNDRVIYHNKKRGSKFTKYIPTFGIVLLEQYSSLTDARKREIQIKKWRRDKKELLTQRYSTGLDTKK